MRTASLALLLLALPPRAARAQNFPANLHGTVSSLVSIARVNDLAFGAVAIVPGVPTTVAPANGALVRVDYNVPTTVTAPDFVMIAGPGGALLRVDLACASDPTASSAAPTPFANPCSGGVIPPLAGNVGGTYYIYIGGTVVASAAASVPAGSYAGSFSVTATYVNF